jgi:hypothetical protein
MVAAWGRIDLADEPMQRLLSRQSRGPMRDNPFGRNQREPCLRVELLDRGYKLGRPACEV